MTDLLTRPNNNMQRRVLKNAPRNGFILIEVIVGMGVLTTLLAAFYALLLQSGTVSRINERELTASMYLREMVEVANDLEKSNWGGA